MRRAALVLLAFVLTGTQCAEPTGVVVYFPGPADACDGEPIEVGWSDGESWVYFNPPTVEPGDCAVVDETLALDLLAVRCPGAPLSDIVRAVLGEGDESMCERWVP